MRVPGKVPCGGWGSAPVVAPHGLGKHGGRSCDLERELGREIAQRRHHAARAHTPTRTDWRAAAGEAVVSRHVHVAGDC